MSSIRKRFVAAAVALALLPASASAGVVVASSGPSAATYPVGRKLAPSDRIVLQAGDSLTVLDGNGTRVLRGAGSFSLNQRAGASKRSTFTVLTERRSAARMRTGAVRNVDAGGAVTQPNLWYVDVAHPGKVCLAGSDATRLWRAATDKLATYTITAGAGGKSQKVTFVPGEALAPWDTAALPLAAETEYHIAGADGASPGALTFAILPQPASDPETLAQQLIDNGCTMQLEILANTMLTTPR
jgi:hypothetical protein